MSTQREFKPFLKLNACVAGIPILAKMSNLTAVFFETGAMLTPTKSQNGTNCGSGGSFQSYLTHS